jgi:hypothetical protein
MFEPGTKVILVESSLHKTIGPRKGSIGYVSNCSFTRTIPAITEGFGSFNVVASLCEIVFIRFGFEEHGRVERKHVISIFPLIKNGNLFNKDNKKETIKESICGIDKHVKDLCNMIASQKDSYLWENIRDNCEVSSSVPVALIVPLSYDTTDLTTCKDVEFKAWITSYLNSIPISKFVDSTGKSSHYTNYNDSILNKSETWGHLHLLTSDRDYRHDYIRNHLMGIEERKECILLVRKIIATLSHVKLKRIKAIIEEIPSICSYDFTVACYDVIGPYVYNRVAMSLFIDAIKHTHTPNIADDILSTIAECISLSDSMLCSNNGFGYTTLNSK